MGEYFCPTAAMDIRSFFKPKPPRGAPAASKPSPFSPKGTPVFLGAAPDTSGAPDTSDAVEKKLFESSKVPDAPIRSAPPAATQASSAATPGASRDPPMPPLQSFFTNGSAPVVERKNVAGAQEHRGQIAASPLAEATHQPTAQEPTTKVVKVDDPSQAAAAATASSVPSAPDLSEYELMRLAVRLQLLTANPYQWGTANPPSDSQSTYSLGRAGAVGLTGLGGAQNIRRNEALLAQLGCVEWCSCALRCRSVFSCRRFGLADACPAWLAV